jgi:hypothetical protein
MHRPSCGKTSHKNVLDCRTHQALQISDREIEVSQELLERIRDAVERRLHENAAYAYARKLGQLGELRIELVNAERAQTLTSEFLNGRLLAGYRLGDIKPSPLVLANGDHR